MSKKPPTKSARLDFLVSAEFRETMEMLKVRTDADSLTEVLRRAVKVYQWLEAAHHSGLDVRLHDNEGTSMILAFPEFAKR